MELQAKKAIVTGSTKGIGFAIAEALVREGVRLVVTARTDADVRKTVESLERAGGTKVVGTPCDVSRLEDVRQLMAFTVRELGGLDILVNNAGVGGFASIEEMTPELWRRTIGTNLDALFYTCHLAIPEMKKAGGGFIINIGSLAGKNAFAGGAAYNASKFGLIGFSEAIMQDVRQEDIQVAYIMPGSVDTDFGGPGGPGSSWKIAPSDVAEVVVQTLKRHPRCLTSRIEMRPSKPPKK